MRYAMILLNNVIGVLEQDAPPSWPPDPQGNPVITVECDDSVELGMVYDFETGTFSEYVPPAYVPTQLDRIETQLAKNYADAAQDAIDNYTAELVEGGVL